MTTLLLIGAAAPATEADDPAKPLKEYGIVETAFPLTLDEDLHPDLEGRIFFFWVVSATFGEFFTPLWLLPVVTERAPDGYWTDMGLYTALHVLSAGVCPPVLVPLNAFYLLPVLAINTYSRLSYQAEADGTVASPMTFNASSGAPVHYEY